MKSDFEKLEALRLLAKKYLDVQKNSLAYFSNGLGYFNTENKGSHVSVSSTATCVLSLTATGRWPHNPAKTKSLLRKLIPRKESSDLAEDNPFTTAWILEAVTALLPLSSKLDAKLLREMARKERVLQGYIRTGHGGVRIDPYPASGYLTQLAVRTLIKRDALPKERAVEVKRWAWSELVRQLALIDGDSKSQDAFSVAYLLIVISMLTPKSEISPEEFSIQRVALAKFFQCQLKDGTWPLSKPLFHYPKIGNAHCYEYELLTQLLSEPDLADLLLEHLPALERSVQAIESTAYNLHPGIFAWSSGHHPQQPKPESWATASVYHFFYKLDRLLAKAVRIELFRHMELPLPAPGSPKQKRSEFAVKLLDSSIFFHGAKRSLRQVLWRNFVQPISSAAINIENGIKFDDSTPRAAIFFGPPGTSKTELAREVANFLGWPFLPIDPSMLLKRGMNEIQAEANAVFKILEQTEGVVVLLDEFDELVQDRELDNSEQPSRLLTTAMLPKLAGIHKKGTLVLILATNHIDRFDLAIRRQGRFDRVLQIMPPTLPAKLANKGWGAKNNVDVGALFRQAGYRPSSEIKASLNDLTYGEFNNLADELASKQQRFLTAKSVEKVITSIAAKSTMSTPPNDTWRDRSKKERENIR